MKKTLFQLFLCLVCLQAQAQQRQPDRENPSMLRYPVIATRNEIITPKVNGYNVIKADLHVHTIYSDGNLTPYARITEAWRDGLDAIAITDHIEGRPNVKSFGKYLAGNVRKMDKEPRAEKTDMNFSVDEAVSAAANLGITLIPGIEITRDQIDTGHFNVLFSADNNLIHDPDPLQAIRNAKKQNAIVQINHPGWDRTDNEFTAVAKAAIGEGLISGVEVFNSYEFYPDAIEKAVDMGFYICCGSDLHITSQERYGHYGMLRDMTLILAGDSSPESIREALENRRTLAYAYGDIAGNEALLKDFFRASVNCKVLRTEPDGRRHVQITNSSSFPFILSLKGFTVDYTLEGLTSITYTTREDAIPVTVTNMWFGVGKHPATTLAVNAD